MNSAEREKIFQSKLEHLKAYRKENGDAMVPYAYRSPDGFWLGNWVKVQRELRATGRLSKERVDALNNEGFVWAVDHFMAQRKGSDEKFEEFFKYLLAFKKEFGHCDVIQTYVCPDGYRLGTRVNKKRLRPERMTEEQRVRLSAIGFLWKSKNTPHCQSREK